MHPLGFLRISTASTGTHVANPAANRQAIERALLAFQSSDVILFPELCLTGYTCGELFLQDTLLESALHELKTLCQSVGHQVVVVGLPLKVQGRLYNIAAVLANGTVLGLVPKTHLPNYSEFYEARWFHSGGNVNEDMQQVDLPGIGQVPFGTDLLFQSANVTIGVEICEDLWVPIPPSSSQAIAGANVLLNLSASNETIAKANYRKQLVTMQSGKCIAAYAYASSGPTESTTDLVFGGHCIIAENGAILAESKRIGTGLPIKKEDCDDGLTSFATADIDLDRLDRDRRAFQTFHQSSDQSPIHFERIPFELSVIPGSLCRWVEPHPFVDRKSTRLNSSHSSVSRMPSSA